MASDTFKVLVTIANQFLEQGNPMQAIKCLQALCLSDKAEYPQLEAEVRLKMAELLLEHTFNIREATKTLERANWLLTKINGFHSLKCAVLAKLLVCHKLNGSSKQVRLACKSGLQLAQQGMDSSARSEFLQWALHFHTVLAEAQVSEQETEEALATLQAAIVLAKKSQQLDVAAMLLLGVLQLHIQEGKPSEVHRATQEAASAIVALETLPEGAPSEPHLKLHFEVLRATWLLSQGETIQLQKKEEGGSGVVPTTVVQLQQLAREAFALEIPYHFLPKGCLPALAEIIAASIWRPTGKFSKAQPHLDAACQYLDAAEKAVGLNLEEGEDELPPQQREAAQKLAWLRALVLENSAIIAITKQELVLGGRHVASLMSLIERLPRLLSQLRGPTHLLAGNYCSECGISEAAGRHFMAALECSTELQTRRIAAVEAALSLMSSRESQAVPQAMEILKQNGLFCAQSTDHAPPESSAGHYATATVLLRQGNLNEGRTFIMKALKLAHAPLHNHQLVAKIMCALVPTYMEDDLPAVQSMTNTALSLSKGLYDLPTQITAAEYTREWMERLGMQEKLPEQEEYIQRKRLLLSQAVEKATAQKAQHARILAWDLTAPEKLMSAPRGTKRATSLES